MTGAASAAIPVPASRPTAEGPSTWRRTERSTPARLALRATPANATKQRRPEAPGVEGARDEILGGSHPVRRHVGVDPLQLSGQRGRQRGRVRPRAQDDGHERLRILGERPLGGQEPRQPSAPPRRRVPLCCFLTLPMLPIVNRESGNRRSRSYQSGDRGGSAGNSPDGLPAMPTYSSR